MAEVQKTTQSGEMAQQFIEFVMMQAQNAALFLGQFPNPQTGKAEVNLEVARMFIDQLVMIREKTRGNLSSDESSVLASAISGLQMAFVEASRGVPGGVVPPAGEVEGEDEDESVAPAEPAAAGEPAVEASPSEKPPEDEPRKRFTKSYG